MTDHFKPLWARNVPKFGIAHAMALGVSACCWHLLHSKEGDGEHFEFIPGDASTVETL